MREEFINSKIEESKAQLDELRRNIVKYKETLKQMELNEYALNGYLEGLRYSLRQEEEEE